MQRFVRLFWFLCPSFMATLFWATFSNFLIIQTTEKYLFDDLEKIPEKEFALVLGATKNGKYGPNPYFKYRM